MLLYTHTITPRLQYITEFIGREMTGEPLQLTTDIKTYQQFVDPKINYSHESIAEGELHIQPHSLLFEKDIKHQRIECTELNGKKIFFKTQGDSPFDIFAATFYLLSRYEEYLPHQKDIYGRYAHKNSLAFKEQFLHQPLVNHWIEEFRKLLKEKFPELQLPVPAFKLLLTYDIDEAWSYKHKPWSRTIGGLTKAFLNGQWTLISERIKVLQGKMKDPFDAYQWMDNLHSEYRIEPLYFFLVADKSVKYDKNISPNAEAMQDLIRHHANKYKVGVHPSWQSGDEVSLITKEIATVEQLIDKKIISSRQHFIRLTLPHTYRYLIEAGIKEDFSMGYGSINGFRASVASPFYWYDLEKDQTTGLLLYPFCFMEANSFFEQHFSPQQALEEMRQYYNEVRSVNGTYSSIWHNTFLGTSTLYKGWREVYKQFIEEITE